MLEPLALIIGLAVIFAVVLGAGLLTMLILAGVFFLILFLTKAILLAVLAVLILASPFIALGLLSRLFQGRTVPGTTWPLGKTIVVAGLAVLLLAALTIGNSLSGVQRFMDQSRTMMEECDQGGDHSSDMVVGNRHYHFSCHGERPADQSM